MQLKMVHCWNGPLLLVSERDRVGQTHHFVSCVLKYLWGWTMIQLGLAEHIHLPVHCQSLSYSSQSGVVKWAYLSVSCLRHIISCSLTGRVNGSAARAARPRHHYCSTGHCLTINGSAPFSNTLYFQDIVDQSSSLEPTQRRGVERGALKLRQMSQSKANQGGEVSKDKHTAEDHWADQISALYVLLTMTSALSSTG